MLPFALFISAFLFPVPLFDTHPSAVECLASSEGTNRHRSDRSQRKVSYSHVLGFILVSLTLQTNALRQFSEEFEEPREGGHSFIIMFKLDVDFLNRYEVPVQHIPQLRQLSTGGWG